MQNTGITRCFVAQTGEAALTWLEDNACNIVVFEHNLTGMNGFQLLNLVRRSHHKLKLIATARTKDIKFAVSLMKQGASDFVPKDDFFSSSIGRAVQGAARDLSFETEVRTTEVLGSRRSSHLDTGNVEAAWLLKMFRNRYGYAIPSPASREDDLRRWEDIVATFKDYVETSLRMFRSSCAQKMPSSARSSTAASAPTTSSISTTSPSSPCETAKKSRNRASTPAFSSRASLCASSRNTSARCRRSPE